MEEKKTTPKMVKFKKLIKGSYSLNGVEFHGEFVELSAKDATNEKVLHAIKCGVLEKVK